MGLEAGISATAAHHLTASGPLASRVRGLKEGNERIILAARRETGVLVRPQQSLPPDLSAIPLIDPWPILLFSTFQSLSVFVFYIKSRVFKLSLARGISRSASSSILSGTRNLPPSPPSTTKSLNKLGIKGNFLNL